MRRILRWTARLVVGLVLLAGIGAGAVYGLSQRRIARRFEVPEHPLRVPTDSASVAAGKRLATIRGCNDCHAASMAGQVMIDDPAVGRLASANLTTGRAAPLTARDWERAVRHGVRRDGSPLFLMPSHEFAEIADDDLAAIVAYAQSLPPVRSTVPATRPGPIVRALHLAGQFVLLPAEQIDHARPHAAHVDAEPTAKYGDYLARGCIGCHGPNLSGGKIPGAPPEWKPAANITSKGIAHYTEADFIRALRTGVRPGGTPIDTLMPWRLTKEMTDVELKALYAYLKTVPAREYGNR